MNKKFIQPSERRHQDYLRKKTLKSGAVFETRLAKARRGELRRVLALARDLNDVDSLPSLLEGSLTEASYLPGWWQGLWTEVGVPASKATAQDLRQAKAAGETDIWLSTLRRYALTRAGNEIVTVTGTWKSSLVNLLRTYMADEIGIGIEKLAKKLYNGYVGTLERWQCRRIAQTEAMIGAAEGADLAARTLDVGFTKQWCISGLGNTRASHELMDGVEVDENEPFSLPGGLLMYPHDTSFGADASEIINCACACIRRPKGFMNETVSESPEPKTQEDERIEKLMKELDPSIPEDDRRLIAENEIALENALGKKKGEPMTIKKADEQSANPKYLDEFIPDPKGIFVDKDGNRFSKNPKYSGANKRYHVNCATCTPAYELRRRGFDITAKGRIGGRNDLNNQVAFGRSFDIWKNPDGTDAKPTLLDDFLKKEWRTEVTPEVYKRFLEESTKEKGRYTLTLKWKGGGGHATVLERKANGKLVYIEPQHYDAAKGVERSIDELCDRVSRQSRSKDGVMRMDNKILDPKWAGLFNTK